MGDPIIPDFDLRTVTLADVSTCGDIDFTCHIISYVTKRAAYVMPKTKKDQGVQVISVIYIALKDNRPSVANYILLTEKEMTAHIQQVAGNDEKCSL